MSIQAETVPSNGSSGPGLSGLQQSAAVNQSAGEPTAQHHHHGHESYSSAYASFPSISVPYDPPYNSEVNLPPYYPHDTQHSHSSAGPQTHHDQPQRPQQSSHHESMPSQDRPIMQQTGQGLNQSESCQSGTGHAEHRASVSYQPAPPASTLSDVQDQPFAESSASSSKRRYESTNGSEDEAQHSRKQRQRLSVTGAHTDTDVEIAKDESEVGPSGGPKHWTDEEKARLFHWMLDDDDRWEAFGTKMNTVFREGSAQLFNSRKSFTALKSCYHRNLEIFKQIYVFEAFLARATIASLSISETNGLVASTSTSDASANLDPNEVAAIPTPPSFASASDRQTFLERKIEAAKALNVPVSNLTVKVIDHWFDMGWFILFKKRFEEDPKTGLPTPRYAADREGDDDAEGEEVHDDLEHAAPSLVAQNAGTTSDALRRHLDPMGCLIPPPFPNPSLSTRTTNSHRSHRAVTPSLPTTAGPNSHQQVQLSQGSSHYSHSAQSSPQLPYGYALHPPIQFFSPTAPVEYQTQQQQLLHFQMQTSQSLAHLTNMTQTLLSTCNTLVELVKTQAEDIRAQTELLRRREERELLVNRQSADSGSMEHSIRPDPLEPARIADRAAAATEVLANPRLTDDVKHAASEYLKRLFQ